MRRILLAIAACAALAVASPTAQAAKSWAQKDIKTVVAAGLLAPTLGDFRPDDPLTKGELAELVAALGATAKAPANPDRPVKVRELDGTLVRALKLKKSAVAVQRTLVAAGLGPKKYAGSEVVARMLGLRPNHPQPDDALELLPGQPVTRAETAYSVARLLELRGGWTVPYVASQASAFSVPELTEWQRAVLSRAVRFIGWPYVWGGSSERTQAPFGVPVSGGFDCSGFTWRVYKLEPFDGGGALGSTLVGRTSYAMAGEVGKGERLAFADTQPADVLFFGDKGPKSQPSQVSHMGIYLGNGWMVHASTRGTTITSLEGWYTERFAWARRPLAEAGLA